MKTRSPLAVPGAIAVALILAGLVVVGFLLAGRQTTGAVRPAPTITVTRTLPAKTVVRKKIVHRVRHVPVPGPTVTVTSGASQVAYLQNCISVLYQNISSWTTFPGRRVPNGWWDARCPSAP